jgi:hypothetical protein
MPENLQNLVLYTQEGIVAVIVANTETLINVRIALTAIATEFFFKDNYSSLWDNKYKILPQVHMLDVFSCLML